MADGKRLVMLTHLSLFTGIGGIDIAAEWAGFTTVGQCEFAPYPRRVLEKHWPDVPRWEDIKTLTKESFYGRTGLRTVDLISGGFPCQPFSTAGKRKGKEDERHLWPEMLRVIRDIAPHFVVAENVFGLVSIALDDVLADLERTGYTGGAFAYEAAAVGAPHRRMRVFIVAHASLDTGDERRPESAGLFRETGAAHGGYDVAHADAGLCEPAHKKIQAGRDIAEYGGGIVAHAHSQRQQQPQGAERSVGGRAGDGGEDDTDTDLQRREEQWYGFADAEGWAGAELLRQDVSDADFEQRERGGASEQLSGQPESANGSSDVPDTDDSSTARLGEHGGEVYGETEPKGSDVGCSPDRWAVEPGLGRLAHGISDRVAKLRCLGNAVVPQQIYPLLLAIREVLDANRH